MADMIERVARAICFDRQGKQWDCVHGCSPDTGCLGPLSPSELDHARAAIEAMRPLPPELFVHSVRSYADERGNDYEDHADWWSEMIDAALNSSPPSQ